MMRAHHMFSLAALLLAGTALAQVPGAAPATPSAPDISLPAAMPSAPTTPATPSAMDPAAPMGELPAMVPDVDASAPAAPAAPAPTGTEEASQPVAAAAIYSYGTFESSVLFTANQIRNMKQALKAFEGIRGEKPTLASEDMTITEFMPPEPEKVQEPTTYPAYYLSSIVFKSANDWTVWVNNSRITPRTNDGDLKVVAVKPDRAWFSWEPKYIQTVADRISRKDFSETDKVKHRFSDENTAAYDNKTSSVLFSLRPNQTFVAGYFRSFEGKMDAPAMKAAPAAVDPGFNGETMSPDAASAINGLLGSDVSGQSAPTMPGNIPMYQPTMPFAAPSRGDGSAPQAMPTPGLAPSPAPSAPVQIPPNNPTLSQP